MAWKFLDFQGLQTLAGFINKIKETADESSSAVSELESDFQTLSTLTTSALEEMGEALEGVPVEDLTTEELQKIWDDAEIVILPPEEISVDEIESDWKS